MSKFVFSVPTGRSSDHKWIEKWFSGLPIIATRVSHNSGEIGKNLESKIARQCRVRTGFFREMIGCSKDLNDYELQVRKDPYPPFETHF